MNDIKSIINRMKEAFKIRTNKELAGKLGTSLSNIDNWKKRNSIPQKYILLTSQMTDTNPNWLLTGEGEMYKTPSVQNSIIAQGNNHKIIGNTIGNNINNELKELCEAFQKLPEKKRKYFYHLIMAEMYKEEE